MPYQVPTAGIEDSAINSNKIATDAVGTSEIISDGVRTVDIQNSAVTTDKINNDAVTNAKIADDAVQTDQIQDASVTLAKCETSLTNALVPIKGIIMFSGTTAEIPSSFALCDGQNGTPDLRDKFVIAASVDSTGWKTTVTGSNTSTGGSKDGVLREHNHTISSGGASGNFLTGASLGYNNAGPFQYGGDATAVSGINFNTNSGSVSYTDPVSSTEGDVGSLTDANLPPYYALAFIMRTT